MYDLNGFFNIPVSSRILNSKEWWQPRHGMDLKIAQNMFRDVAHWVQFEQPGFWLLNVEWRVFDLRHNKLRSTLASSVKAVLEASDLLLWLAIRQ
jgi:hypothetical protein